MGGHGLRQVQRCRAVDRLLERVRGEQAPRALADQPLAAAAKIRFQLFDTIRIREGRVFAEKIKTWLIDCPLMYRRPNQAILGIFPESPLRRCCCPSVWGRKSLGPTARFFAPYKSCLPSPNTHLSLEGVFGAKRRGRCFYRLELLVHQLVTNVARRSPVHRGRNLQGKPEQRKRTSLSDRTR